MFKGYSFIFNEVPSEKFGLKIGFLNENKTLESFSGLVKTIEEVKLKRIDKPIFYGVENSGKITFDLMLYSETELDTFDRQAIDRWLFLNEYKYFQIEQLDYEGLFFNCIITGSPKITVGNTPYMKTITVVCDSPYAYTDEYIYNYTSTTTPSSYNIDVLSNIHGYSYPQFTILTTTSGNINIENETEEINFGLTGLSDAETITADNENKILTSSTVARRIGVFTKEWFKLVPDNNNIKLTGNFTLEIKIRYNVTV